MRLSNLFAAAILFSATAVADGENIIDFNRDIRPIHADRCFKCYGPDEKNVKPSYVSDSFPAQRRIWVEPGKPDRSEYYFACHGER
jgi:hypothetical protein